MIQSQSIHGHEIIFLIHDAVAPLTRAQLEAEVHQRYGTEARFHTCSDEGMTLAQLLAFLVDRGKVVERDGRLRVEMSQVCAGDGDHAG